jgi:glycosyltransferase
MSAGKAVESRMKISVVTVAYNSAGTIRQTVESFLRQRYVDKELLIIDACSTDETVPIVQSYRADSIRIVSEKDAGIYDAMNKGLGLFAGEAVGFLNSDDTFRTDKSLDLVGEGLRDADIVFGDLYMVTDHRTKRVFRTWKAGEFSASAFRFGWMPPHPTFYMRRSVAEKVGMFDLRYRIASDYDYMLRAMLVPNHRIKYVPHFLIDYQVGGISSGSVRGVVQGNLECLDSRRRHLRSSALDAALFLRPLRRLLQVRWSFPFDARLRGLASVNSHAESSSPASHDRPGVSATIGRGPTSAA